MHNRWKAVAALLVALAVLAGCGGAGGPQDAYRNRTPAGQGDAQAGGQQGSGSQAGGSQTSGSQTSGVQTGGVQTGGSQTGGAQSDVGQREPKQWDEPPAMAIDPEKRYTATMETSLGTMTFELFASEVPQTVNNFVFLAREGFYDGVVFHRIIKDFMIQGGDPTGTGTGGPGYNIPDEYPVQRPYKRGTLAMARTSQPNSAGSQFFICTGLECGGLGRQPVYVIFGQLLEGDDVLTQLENVEVKQGNSFDPVPSTPVDPPVITRVTITEE